MQRNPGKCYSQRETETLLTRTTINESGKLRTLKLRATSCSKFNRELEISEGMPWLNISIVMHSMRLQWGTLQPEQWTVEISIQSSFWRNSLWKRAPQSLETIIKLNDRCTGSTGRFYSSHGTRIKLIALTPDLIQDRATCKYIITVKTSRKIP